MSDFSRLRPHNVYGVVWRWPDSDMWVPQLTEEKPHTALIFDTLDDASDSAKIYTDEGRVIAKPIKIQMVFNIEEFEENLCTECTCGA